MSLLLKPIGSRHNLTGAESVSAVNCLVMKRALLIAAVFAGLCFPVRGQQLNQVKQSQDETAGLDRAGQADAFDAASALVPYRPEIFKTLDGSTLIDNLAMRSLWVERRVPVSSALGQMGIVQPDLFPLALGDEVKSRKANTSEASGKDSSGAMVLSRLNPVYYGGEVGVFYGHSSGKFGGDDFATYMTGTVGTDKVQITVGASYEESNREIPRLRVLPR